MKMFPYINISHEIFDGDGIIYANGIRVENNNDLTQFFIGLFASMYFELI